MRQSEDKLTFMQTLIMVSSTMIGAGVLTLPRSAAETDSPIGWIMILLQGVIFIIFALLFLPFLQRNSERTIFELNSIAAGKLIGFFLNVFISIYFIGIVCFQARVLGEVVGFFLLKKHSDGSCRVYFSGGCHLSCGRGRLPHCEGICVYLSYHYYYFPYASDV